MGIEQDCLDRFSEGGENFLREHIRSLRPHYTAMEVKTYGKEDADPALFEALKAYASSQGCASLVVAFHQRRSMAARPCAIPGSVTYDFVMDGRAPLAARQYRDGRIECPVKR